MNWYAVLWTIGMMTQSDSASVPQLVRDPQIAEMVKQVDAARIEADIKTLVGFGTRHTLSQTDSDTRGIGAARTWIKAEFERISQQTGGRLTVKLDGYRQEPDGNRVVKPVEIFNVVATLPGSRPDSAGRVYLVSGHYDSRASDPLDFQSDAPGADDDATGVAAVIEMARVMSGHEFDATVMFIAFAGEEQGLLGSKYAARQMRTKGVDVAGMFTNDIIGNSLSVAGVRDRQRACVFSEGVPLVETPEQAKVRQRTGSENDSPARQLARYVDAACGTYVLGFDVVLIYRLDRFMRGGDHKSFSLQGYPAIRFTEMYEDYRHQHQDVRVVDDVQYGDLPEFVDYEYAANVTRVNVAALASLARAPRRPMNVRVDTASLGNDTTLRWDANREPDLDGYLILWRETTAPQWQASKRVGKVSECTIPLSKDNYIFGVCAMDKEGHRSEAAYPWQTVSGQAASAGSSGGRRRVLFVGAAILLSVVTGYRILIRRSGRHAD